MYRRVVPMVGNSPDCSSSSSSETSAALPRFNAGYGKRRERQENRRDDPCDSTGGKTMSYATMQDALFALDLADSELWDRPRHPEESTDEPELPEEPGELRRAPKATMRRAA